MAELVASRSTQTLADLAVKEKSAKEKIEGEVNKLVSVLSQTEKMLNDGHKIEVVKNMEVIMRFTYMIEDFLESWAVRVEAAYMRKRGIKRILRRWFGQHDDGTAIIRMGIFVVENLFGGRDNISPNDFPEIGNREAEGWSEPDGSKQVYDVEEHFVRMKDFENLTTLVKSKRVVSICGVEGMGKTSLSRKVYNHAEVRTRFQAFASVSFTQHPEITSLLQNILNQLVAEEQKRGSGDSQVSGIKQKRVNNTKRGATTNQGNKTEDVEKEKGAGAEQKDVDQEGKKGKSEKVVEDNVDEEKENDGKAVKKSVHQGNKIEEEEKEVGVEAVNNSVADQEREKGAGAEQKNVDQESKRGEAEIENGGKVVDERVDWENEKDVEAVRNLADRENKIEEEKEKGAEAVKKSSYVEKRKVILMRRRKKPATYQEKEKGAEAVKKRVDSKEEEKEKEMGVEVVPKNAEKGAELVKQEEEEKAIGVEAVSKSAGQEKDKDAEAVRNSADQENEIEEAETKNRLEKKEERAEAVNKSVGQEKDKDVEAMRNSTDQENEIEEEETKKRLEKKEEGAEAVNKSVDQENTKEGEKKEKGGEAVKRSANMEKRKGIVMRRRKKPAYQEEEKGAEAVKKRADQENTKEEEEEKEVSVEVVQKNADQEKEKGAELVEKEEEEKEKYAEAMKKSGVDQDKGTQGVKKSAFLEAIRGLQPSRKKKQADQMKKIGVEEKEQSAEAENKKGENEEVPKSDDQKQQLINELNKIQGRKKCFIVIDNISETSQWTEISSAFDCKETRILITAPDTTTIPNAVSHEETEADKVFYELKPLNEEEGWKLLQKNVFRGKRAPEKGIVPKLGKDMLQECNGLPLKISSLGRILSKMPLSEWHKVNKDVKHYLQRDDYQTQSNEKTDEASFPTYDQLNYHKKQCFLFLAIFKGNENVDSEDLKFLWMAEGMVPPHNLPAIVTRELQQATMDIAENYVQELADNLAANGRFKPLYLRNYVRELSLYYGVREEFRLKVLDFSGGQQPTFLPFFYVRRLAIHFNKLSSSLEKDALYGTTFLRSLFFLNFDQEYTILPVRISNFKEFELLRVLHFVRCKFDGRKLPQGIDELYNLRYLGVLYCDLDELPASIRNIRNLHILNVRAYHDAKITIPNDIYQMARLKHLRLPDNLDGEQSTMPRHPNNSVHEQSNKLKLDGLCDLESLDGFNADIHDVESLYELKKLRHLVAHANSNDSLESVMKFVSVKGARVRTNLYLESKCNFTSDEGLEILEEVLMCPNLHSLTLSMAHVDEFPNCGTHASKDLIEIKLIGCKLSKDPMGALGNFPNLQKLCLGYGAFVGKEMSINDKGFPKLEYLELSCLSNLEEWRVDEGAMKRLLAMTVKRCPKLNRSTFVSSLKNLQMVLEQRNNDENEMLSFKKSHIRSNDFIPWVTDFVGRRNLPSSSTYHDDAILFPESITTSSVTQAQKEFNPSSSGSSSAH